MIYATDLDRTLIYSKRFSLDEDLKVLVEKKEDKDISYMTRKATKILKQLSEETTFIPTTARNYDEYKRISILQEINPKYVVANIGGSIYIEGKEDENWKQFIKEKVSKLPLSHSLILDKFLELRCVEKIKKIRLSGNLIWVVVVEPDYDIKRIDSFVEYAIQNGWKTVFTRNKICILPHFINKWSALEYLRNYHLNNEEKLVAAGDSIWDIEMVTRANVGIVPQHGEIKDIIKYYPSTIVTFKEGLLGGEEILKLALEFSRQNKNR